jgi:colanic acid/amylovoran biosynthesis protein
VVVKLKKKRIYGELLMKKRFLVCAYFAKNIGDDLFLKILFDRYQGIQWELLTANRNYKKIFKGYNNVRIIYTYRNVNIGKFSINPFFKINELFLKYNRYDGLINIGGSIFMQSPSWKMKIDERWYLLNKFKRKNKKTFIIGANFGPYKDYKFIQEYKELFTLYDDICFRDSESFNAFKELNNVRVAPDIVFSLKNSNFTPKEKKIGFSIINLENREGLCEFQESYNKRMIELIEKYSEFGYKINLFSFCENEGDLKIINDLKRKIKPVYQKELEIVAYEGNIDEFLNKFKACELIIGTRFHSIILALLFNQSVYPIIYSDKTFNVLKDLGMENDCCYIKDLENLVINDVVSTAFNNKLKNRKVLSEALKQFEKLDYFIG